MSNIPMPELPNRDPQSKIDIVIEKFNQTREYADTAFNTALSIIESISDTIMDIADVPTDISFGDYILDMPISIEEYLSDTPVNPIEETDYIDIKNLPFDPIEYIRDTPINPIKNSDYDDIKDLPIEPTSYLSDTPVNPIEETDYIDIKNLPFDPIEYIRDTPINPITNSDYDDIEHLRPTSGLNYEEETEYISELLDALKNKLLNVINGTGTLLISRSILDQILSIETEQQKLINQEAKERHAMEFTERGFDLPGGGLFSKFEQIETEYQNKLFDKARKIAEETIKLEIENIWKALEVSNALESKLCELKGKYWERKLEAAVKVVETAMAIYTGAIESLKTKAQVYGIEAGAYEAEIKAIAAIGDFYSKLNIESLKTKAQVYGIETGAYEAKLRSAAAIGDLYSKINIESLKTKAQVYGIETGAYEAKLRSIAAIGDFYSKLNIESLKTKAQVYGIEAGAYEAKLRSIAAIAGVYAELNKAKITYETAKADSISKEIGADIRQVEIKANIALEALRQSGSMAAQLCASALSAVAASASISSRDEASVSSYIQASETWDHNISSSE